MQLKMVQVGKYACSMAVALLQTTSPERWGATRSGRASTLAWLVKAADAAAVSPTHILQVRTFLFIFTPPNTYCCTPAVLPLVDFEVPGCSSVQWQLLGIYTAQEHWQEHTVHCWQLYYLSYNVVES